MPRQQRRSLLARFKAGTSDSRKDAAYESISMTNDVTRDHSRHTLNSENALSDQNQHSSSR